MRGNGYVEENVDHTVGIIILFMLVIIYTKNVSEINGDPI